MSVKDFKLLTRSYFFKVLSLFKMRKINSGKERLEADKLIRGCCNVKFSWAASQYHPWVEVDEFKSNLKGKHCGDLICGIAAREKEDSMHNAHVSGLSSRLSHWDYTLYIMH